MSDMLILRYYRITNRGHPPVKTCPSDVGYDLKSADSIIIPARQVAAVNTDIAIRLPPGTYGRIAPRSGLALYNSIDIGGGVLDPLYYGNIIIIIFNHNDHPFQINSGDRIAQLIIEKYQQTELEEVYNWHTLTDRGSNALGSSGI